MASWTRSVSSSPASNVSPTDAGEQRAVEAEDPVVVRGDALANLGAREGRFPHRDQAGHAEGGVERGVAGRHLEEAVEDLMSRPWLDRVRHDRRQLERDERRAVHLRGVLERHRLHRRPHVRDGDLSPVDRAGEHVGEEHVRHRGSGCSIDSRGGKPWSTRDASLMRSRNPLSKPVSSTGWRPRLAAACTRSSLSGAGSASR